MAGAQLVLYFASTDLMEDPSGPVRELLATLPEGALCSGCSTAGEIQAAQVNDGTLSALAIRFAHTRVRAEQFVVSSSGDSEQAGIVLGKSLQSDDLRHVLVLSDGLALNGSELTRALRETLPSGVIVSGGLAGDGARFGRTFVGLGGDIAQRKVVAIGFYGDRFHVAHGSAGGWQPFGPKRLITSSEANVLHTLDHQPALSLYRKYLGERAAGLPATGLLFPLQLLPDSTAESGIVRTILAIDEQAQSLTFAGDMPVGSFTRLMRASLDALVDGAGMAAAKALHFESQGDKVALLVSCVGRKLVMGQRVEEEVEVVLNKLGPGVKAAGFYSYGEISPSGFSKNCELHNQTMTLSVFGEI